MQIDASIARFANMDRDTFVATLHDVSPALGKWAQQAITDGLSVQEAAQKLRQAFCNAARAADEAAK